MSGSEQMPPEEDLVDLDDIPFRQPPPPEGIPFERGGDEDMAIKRILERAARRRAEQERH